MEGGVGVYEDQRASLAGVRGRLVEVGRVRLLWRMDRVAFEASGVVWRRLERPRAFAEPVGDGGGAAAGRGGGDRGGTGDGPLGDVGDFLLATIVTLAGDGDERVFLRFGTRLPTTDDRVGLERDRTDFFALVGGQLVRGVLAVTAESGLGIHGARGSVYDQVDVWLYSATVEYQKGALTSSVAIVGQADGLSGPPVRGNEDLREVRLGARIGGGRWLRVVAVRGLADFSPRLGVELALGAAF